MEFLIEYSNIGRQNKVPILVATLFHTMHAYFFPIEGYCSNVEAWRNLQSLFKVICVYTVLLCQITCNEHESIIEKKNDFIKKKYFTFKGHTEKVTQIWRKSTHP